MTRKEEARKKAALKLHGEQQRIAGMRQFEYDVIKDSGLADISAFTEMNDISVHNGKRLLVCGIDEAGRGPLAGPVAAGAVIMPYDSDILYINDSKKLTAARREQLAEQIRSEAVAYNVSLVDAARIDEINILQATYEAMRQAIASLQPVPDVLVVDAVHIPEEDIPQVSIIKADAKCYSVAAASILAKVTRDHLMEQYDLMYPEYGFASHKGYGTAAHIAALRKYGPCPIHRRTFIKHFVSV